MAQLCPSCTLLGLVRLNCELPVGGPIVGEGSVCPGRLHRHSPACPLEGKLAKVTVIAVRDGYEAVLCPLGIASDTAGRGYRLATVVIRE